MPVYEIYKCGEDPHWLEGLDVTPQPGYGRRSSLTTTTTREGRTTPAFATWASGGFRSWRRHLPEGVFVLGVDEHTACTFDLDAGTASVEGRGVVTVRAAGRR